MFPITQPGTTLSLSWSADSNSTGWSITVAPLGGEPPYSIQWDAAAGGHSGPTAQGLSAGTYRVTVTDANGCVRIAAISVGTVGVNAQPKYLSSARIAPNPTSTYSRLQLALAAPIGGRIWVLSPVGQRLVEYSFESHAASQEWLLDATPLPSGLYVVMLLLENGERHALNWSVLKR
jgi:hypothetical protein